MTTVREALEQYARTDYYLWLCHPHGQQSDPTKRAKDALLELDALEPVVKELVEALKKIRHALRTDNSQQEWGDSAADADAIAAEALSKAQALLVKESE
jgi:hypothetical protein